MCSTDKIDEECAWHCDQRFTGAIADRFHRHAHRGTADVEEEASIIYLNASGTDAHLKQRRLQVPNASE